MHGSDEAGDEHGSPDDDFEPTLDVRRKRHVAGQRINPSTDEQCRYQLLHRHARGGSGQVSVAIDQKFGRTVAFKEIGQDRTDEVSTRNLFLREAEVTANLEHPGIVPIYDVGYRQDGSPFYAMRFIEGQSLHVAIQDFHQEHEQSNRLEWQQELRALVGRLIDVCNAVEYAHSRGVLHRDLKPANVMLGPFGETLVVDWGLAGEVNDDAVESGRDSSTIPSHQTGFDDSRQFAAIGTVGYMSPEQSIRGNPQRFTSDIYSLGATLYTILTGKASITCDELSQLRQLLDAGDFQPAAIVEKRTPGPLNAICQKAMAVRPEDRYQSVAGFSASLERWLANQSVEAYSESVRERTVRWVSRHRTLATGVMVLMCAVVVGLGINTRIANIQKQKTEASLYTLMKTTERFFDNTEDYLVGVPALSDLRLELLQESQRLHEEMLVENPSHPGVLYRTSKVSMSVAEVCYATGRIDEAKTAYDRGLELCDLLQKFVAPQISDNPKITARKWYFEARRIHAAFLVEVVSPDQAQDHVEALLQQLRTETELEPVDLRLTTASLNGLLSVVLIKKGQTGEAIEMMNQVVDEFLVNPGATVREMKSYQDRLATVLRQTGELKLAEAGWTDIIAYIEAELELPDRVRQYGRPTYESWLAHSILQRAELWNSLGRTTDAVPELQRAVEISADVANRFPGLPDHTSSLVDTRIALAVTLCRCGRIEESLPHYQLAIDEISTLANRYPAERLYQSVWSMALKNLATAKYQLRQYKESQQLTRQVIDLQKKLVERCPEPSNLLQLASAQLSFAASLTRASNDAEEPLAVYRNATEILEKLATDLPGPTMFRSKLALAYQNQADLLARHWQPEADEFFDKAEAEYLRLADESPENLEFPLKLAMLQDNRGRTALDQQKWQQAVEYFTPALEHFRGAWEEGQRTQLLSLKTIRVPIFLAKAHLGNDNVAEAVRVINDALQTVELVQKEEPDRYNDRVAELLELRCKAMLAQGTLLQDDLATVENSLNQLDTVCQLLAPVDSAYFQLKRQLILSELKSAKQQYDEAERLNGTVIAQIESHGQTSGGPMTDSDLIDLEIQSLQQRIHMMIQKGAHPADSVVARLERAIDEYATGETSPVDAIGTQDERLKLIAVLLKRQDQKRAILQFQAFSDYVSAHQLLQLTRLFLSPAKKTSPEIQTVSDSKTTYPPEIVATFRRLLAANPSAAEELRRNPATAERLKNAGLE